MSNYKHDANMLRRRFVQGLALGGTALGLGVNPRLLFANATESIPVLSGTNFNLKIGQQTVNFTGNPKIATTVNGSLPAPLLRWKQGDTVSLAVTNHLPETSSIHWHGIILPASMDGVPGISTDFVGIEPGQTFTYHFQLKQSGTYWYHSHSGFQEQTGLYGPIIIDPLEPEPFSYDRDYVVMLSDWSDEKPERVYEKLKKQSHYYNFNERTVPDFIDDAKQQGFLPALRNSLMWGEMRMSQRDLADVTGYTYTFLMNGRTPAQGWMGLFKPGEKIRLRFINGAAMSFFDVRIPGLKMTVVAADGQYVQPVNVDEFRIGVAETYDVIVEPQHDQAYTIFAQSMDRLGYARGTLTSDPSLTAVIPALDKVADLSHADMGMRMSDHSGHRMTQANQVMSEMGHNNHGTNNMDHSEHMMPPVQHSDHHMHEDKHTGHKMDAVLKPNPSDFTNYAITHAKTEYGPHVDMRAEDPQYRLSDPGIGLRNNGRKVLTYADLKNLHPTNNEPEPDREVELHLTGNMGRYMWSIDGVKFADAEPLRWKLGERLRVTFVNDTMMNHPMHLHGMWSDLETGDNNYLPRKHTIIVQPGSRISFRVTVDAEGAWAFHCHLLYHMLGMFRTVVVEA